MPLSRRRFLATASASSLLAPNLLASLETVSAPLDSPSAPDRGALQDPTRFEPWITVHAAALRTNVEVLSRLAGGRPIIAVIKNNGYGLGLREVARVLQGDDRIAGFGVVKVGEALSLREAGITKPILLLALWDDGEGEALVRQDVTLSPRSPTAWSAQRGPPLAPIATRGHTSTSTPACPAWASPTTRRFRSSGRGRRRGA